MYGDAIRETAMAAGGNKCQRLSVSNNRLHPQIAQLTGKQMKEWVLHYWANVWIAVGLYWLPLAICCVGYVIRTWRNYRKDRKARDTDKYYSPTDTVGTLIGRGIVSVIPVANLCAAAFDLAPEMLGRFIERIGKIFDQPLVPKRS